MARLRRRGATEELNPWPGYVDALSTLLMVIIFVLLVFVLAQAFLSVALTGRDRALDRLNRQVAELTDILSLERGRAGELQLSTAQLGRDLAAANEAREGLSRTLGALREEGGRVAADRDALRGERDGGGRGDRVRVGQRGFQQGHGRDPPGGWGGGQTVVHRRRES